jgi:hypothetical protein
MTEPNPDTAPPEGDETTPPVEGEPTEQAAPEAKDTTAPEPPSAVEAGVPHVGDAAPEDVDTDPASSVVTPTDSAYAVAPPKTMQEQSSPSLVGAAERRGYFGETAADKAKAAKAQQDAAHTVSTNTEAVAAVTPEQED